MQRLRDREMAAPRIGRIRKSIQHAKSARIAIVQSGNTEGHVTKNRDVSVVWVYTRQTSLQTSRSFKTSHSS